MPSRSAEDTLRSEPQIVKWLAPGAQIVIALLTLASAWGMLRQTVAQAEQHASKIQEDVKGVLETQNALVTRVALLETHKQVTEERLNQIKSTLKDIDEVTRALHDNVLILCQMSGSRERCKP